MENAPRVPLSARLETGQLDSPVAGEAAASRSRIRANIDWREFRGPRANPTASEQAWQTLDKTMS
jgi:hypothetical protein